MRLGIIGHGFVGRAVEYGFSHPQVTIQVVDPKYETDEREKQQNITYKST